MGAALPYRIIALLLGAAACSGDLTLPGDITPPSDGSPAALTVVSGDGQEATVRSRLEDPLMVRVTDARSRPVAGVTVVFGFESSTPEAEVNPTQRETNSEGLATAEVRLGTDPGAHVVEAVAADLRARFDLNAVARGKGQGGGDGDDEDEDDEDD